VRLLLPHVFLNGHEQQVVHCTYYNRLSTPPRVITCVSSPSHELECFAVPLTAIRAGGIAVERERIKVFERDTFKYPGACACVCA